MRSWMRIAVCWQQNRSTRAYASGSDWLKQLRSVGTGAFLFFAVLGAGQTARADGGIEVSVANGLVNLTITEPVPLEDVLDQLAIAFSMTIEGPDGSASVQPLQSNLRTLTETLSLIAPRSSFIIVSGEAGTIHRVVFVANKKNRGEVQTSIKTTVTTRKPERSRDSYTPADAAQLRDIVKLSYRRDRESLKTLKEVVRSKGETSVRVAAIRALASYADLGAVSFLETRLGADLDPEVRLAAAEALVQVNTVQSRDILARAVGLEKDDEVRSRLQAIVEMHPEGQSSEQGESLYKGHLLQK